MNIYDTANKLASEIKQSKEYIDYKELKKKINLNPDKKQKLEEFEKLRYEIQLSSMQEDPNNEEFAKRHKQRLEELQEKYTKLLEDEEMKKYFELELQFNVMIADINKIIAEVVKDVL